MESNIESLRLEKLKQEFSKFLDFHATSFKELDDKAKYWLTIAFPLLIASVGYLLDKADEASPILVSAGWAFVTSLLIAIRWFAAVGISATVRSGFLRPTRDHEALLKKVISNGEEWRDLEFKQAIELLDALTQNETTNESKSRRLRNAEISFFRLAPISTMTAAITAFSYSSAAPPSIPIAEWLRGEAIWSILSWNVLIGLLSTAAWAIIFIVFRHVKTLWKLMKTNVRKLVNSRTEAS